MRRAAKIEIMINENWLPVNGYEGIYEVSNLGKIKRLEKFVSNHNNGGRLCDEVILTPKKRGKYLFNKLFKDGEGQQISIHRIVAIAFIPNPNNLPQVNHKDGNRYNNSVANLEWCSASRNIQHAFETGLKKYVPTKVIRSGALSSNGVRVRCISKDGSENVYGSILEASRETGYGESFIRRRIKGLIKRDDQTKISFSYA